MAWILHNLREDTERINGKVGKSFSISDSGDLQAINAALAASSGQ